MENEQYLAENMKMVPSILVARASKELEEQVRKELSDKKTEVPSDENKDA